VQTRWRLESHLITVGLQLTKLVVSGCIGVAAVGIAQPLVLVVSVNVDIGNPLSVAICHPPRDERGRVQYLVDAGVTLPSRCESKMLRTKFCACIWVVLGDQRVSSSMDLQVVGTRRDVTECVVSVIAGHGVDPGVVR